MKYSAIINLYSHLRDRVVSHPGNKQLIFDLKIGEHVSDFFVINDPAVFGLVEGALGGGDSELVDNNVGHWLVIFGHGVEWHNVVGVGADETAEKTSSRVRNGGWDINSEVKTAVMVGDLDGLVAHLVMLVDDEVNITVGLDAGERIWLR